MTPTPEQLEELIKLSERATPGKWFSTVVESLKWVVPEQRDKSCEIHAERNPRYADYPILTMIEGDRTNQDAEYIAAAHPQRIAELCREVIRLRGALEKIASRDGDFPYALDVKKVARSALAPKGTP